MSEPLWSVENRIEGAPGGTGESLIRAGFPLQSYSRLTKPPIGLVKAARTRRGRQLAASDNGARRQW